MTDPWFRPETNPVNAASRIKIRVYQSNPYACIFQPGHQEKHPGGVIIFTTRN